MTREEKIKVVENAGGTLLILMGLGAVWLLATGAIDVSAFIAQLSDLLTHGFEIPNLGPY